MESDKARGPSSMIKKESCLEVMSVSSHEDYERNMPYEPFDITLSSKIPGIFHSSLSHLEQSLASSLP